MDDSLKEIQRLLSNSTYTTINEKDNDTVKNAQAKNDILRREREKRVCTKCGRNTKI